MKILLPLLLGTGLVVGFTDMKNPPKPHQKEWSIEYYDQNETVGTHGRVTKYFGPVTELDTTGPQCTFLLGNGKRVVMSGSWIAYELGEK